MPDLLRDPRPPTPLLILIPGLGKNNRALITAHQRPIHLRRELDQRCPLRIKVSRSDPRLSDANPRHTAQMPSNRENSCKQLPKS